ncbi:MAG: M4 family metallopeptidase [candidate division Zixibacteria bacterium]|nr:M4 family metallopeptidase [candidate division Zixibacteria bacterium]
MAKYIIIALAGLSVLFVYSIGNSGNLKAPVINLAAEKTRIDLYQENNFKIPTFISGTLSRPVEQGKEIEAAINYFDINKTLYKMTTPSEELKLQRTDPDILGMKHVRLQQYYRNIRVAGGDMVVHFNPENIIQTVNGNYYPAIETDPRPGLSFNEAKTIALSHKDKEASQFEVSDSELVVFPWNNDYYLCWRMMIKSSFPQGRWEYYIDAHRGQVVFCLDRLQPVNDVGTGIGVIGTARNTIETNHNGSLYEMIDSTRRISNNPRGYDGQMPDSNSIITYQAELSLPGTIAGDADNFWDSAYQAAAVDAHVFTGAMYDWWLREFNRNSYDNEGASLTCIVGYSGEGYNNAYWDGLRIVIWRPSLDRRSLAGCPEVIAHEWAHAITDYSSQLAYFKESGALNESFSDIMGAAFEWAHDSLDVPDWLLGENSYTNGAASRDMAEPHNYNDPDFYGLSDPYWHETEGCLPSQTNDYCGVHSNSGVGNKWFYLLAEGGIHHGITVSGLGVENAVRIAYRANVYYWVSGSDFKNAALGTISAACDLDSSGQWAEQVTQAWKAVGVYTPLPKLLFSYPEGIPSLLNRNNEMILEISINGIFGGTIVPGTEKLYYSINDQPYVAVTMMEVNPGRYEAVLPALECDSTIRFFFSAEESSTGVVYMPDTVNPHIARPVTETKIAFHDNFETDKGWNISGTVTSGQWFRGIPYGGGYRTDPVSDFDGSGRCYLTGNSPGDNDVDGGTTILTSPTFAAADDNYEIYYARWYANDYSHAPHEDTMRVLISNDNGLNWMPVETIGPEQQASGGWFTHSFVISDFIAPSDNMKLRFEVSDLGDGSVVEAAIDAVSVSAGRCLRYICGDADNSGDLPDIADITFIISYLYLDGDPPFYMQAANVDGSPDGTIDISDITYLIRFLYMQGAAPICE